MIKRYNNAIIDFSQVQCIEKGTNTIDITFINKKQVSIKTDEFNYLLEGRFTYAKQDEYNQNIAYWQEQMLKDMFNTWTNKGE